MTARAITPVDRPVRGTVVVPGSKSITNRALLIAALAEGQSVLTGALVADDSTAMIDAARVLGASVDASSDRTELTVTGTGGELPNEAVSIYANQAATVARFVSAVAATGEAAVSIDADAQMRERPMAPLFDALRALGARVEATEDRLPATITGPADGGSVTVPAGVSSQFVSALLIAGPLFAKGAQIHLDGAQVSASYVAMTSSVMAKFGIRPAVYPATVAVGAGRYKAARLAIEPDASAASYFFAAAALTGGEVRVENLGSTSVQGDLEVARILESMGAGVVMDHHTTTVTGGPLHGVDVDMSDCSDMVPTVAVVAAAASSPTTVRGVGFIRAKETDRIGVTARELRKCGVAVDEHADGLTIHPSERHGARIDPDGDHRMAMAFAVLGLVTAGIEIDDPGCVAKTFPNFFDVLDSLT